MPRSGRRLNRYVRYREGQGRIPRVAELGGLWASPIGEAFEVLSVPFYLKNVSRGDVVAAVKEEFLRFTEVIRRGGHNTYRLLIAEDASRVVKEVLAELESKGLVSEVNEAGIRIAVDVPSSVDQKAVDAYLLAGTETGRWEMQDGFLASMKTH